MELFFKWVKQHLKIKKFWGDSENAVRIQFYTAIISYCLVAIVHHKMKLKMSVYNTLQVLGISLTDTTPLEDLFNKSNINIDKELDGLYELLKKYNLSGKTVNFRTKFVRYRSIIQQPVRAFSPYFCQQGEITDRFRAVSLGRGAIFGKILYICHRT